MAHAHLVHPDSKVNLKDVDTTPPKGVDEILVKSETDELHDKLDKLQQLIYAAGTHSLLIVLQGRDTSGKDGTIRVLSTCLNVQHVNVASFKQPTAEDLGHDFLWRINKETPSKGHISIFNRSQYEDVLVVRVHDLVPPHVWKKRYEDINDFESEIAAGANTIIVKFYLHISKKEQESRLLAREDDPDKSWKLSVGDWKEREFWGAYTEAYEDALSKCSKKDAPWYIVPADKKWYRDFCVAKVLVESLEPYKKDWEKALEKIGKKAKLELAAFRHSNTT